MIGIQEVRKASLHILLFTVPESQSTEGQADVLEQGHRSSISQALHRNRSAKALEQCRRAHFCEDKRRTITGPRSHTTCSISRAKRAMDGHMLAFTCGTIAGACAGTSYCTRCGSQHHLGAHLWLFEYCAPAHPCVWDCMRYHPSVWDCTRYHP